MDYQVRKIPSYRVIADSGGSRYRFFCDLSGAAVCTTNPIRALTADEELTLAWEREGKERFNMCTRCGKWVCNAMYNADVLECVDCSPWEDPPRFCQECGAMISKSETYCPKCGALLRYGGT